MSIPVRIWRVIRGRWLIADERTRDAQAQQEASHELSQALRGPAAPLPSRSPSAAAPPRRAAASSPRPPHDPLGADLALLGAPPACDMTTLDRLYTQRLAELQ